MISRVNSAAAVAVPASMPAVPTEDREGTTAVDQRADPGTERGAPGFLRRHTQLLDEHGGRGAYVMFIVGDE